MRTSSAASPQARELARLELDRVRVLLGRGEAVSFDPPAADGLDQRLEVGRVVTTWRDEACPGAAIASARTSATARTTSW